MEGDQFNLNDNNYFLPNEDMFSAFLNTNDGNRTNM
jgi:hypothetical protein